MTVHSDSDRHLETQIAEWRAYMLRRRAIRDGDVEELEDHLRATVADLTAVGLRPDEAFLVAVKRMGNLDDLSREFARVHSERLWKQLVLAGGPEEQAAAGPRRDLLAMAACAAVAAVGIKAPALFGFALAEDDGFYQRNLGLFALVPLAAYFAYRRRLRPAGIGVIAALFVIGGLAANVYPLADHSQSVVLTAIHLPLALWLVVGFAYVGGDWRADRKRMDFIRFTGEWLVYFVLISIGGSLLVAVTIGVFDAIGIEISDFLDAWLFPCGGMISVIVGLAGRGQAERRREHGARPDPGLHAPVHRRAAGLPRRRSSDRQRRRRRARRADPVRRRAGDRARAAALRDLRA